MNVVYRYQKILLRFFLSGRAEKAASKSQYHQKSWRGRSAATNQSARKNQQQTRRAMAWAVSKNSKEGNEAVRVIEERVVANGVCRKQCAVTQEGIARHQRKLMFDW